MSDGTPLVLWNSQWSPICGHFFGDNNVGAKLFCNRMGYDDGLAIPFEPRQKYSVDSFRIGRCNKGDVWLNCNGACNDYQVGGHCANGNLNDMANGNAIKCEKNHGPKVFIECLGEKKNSNASCEGGKIILFTILTMPCIIFEPCSFIYINSFSNSLRMH